MYNIILSNIEENSGLWGEFTVYKEFTVKNNTNKTNSKKPNGFLVQVIKKITTANVLCDKNIIKRIEDIDKFTNNKVKYMNHSYIELFPIINGECEYGDNFQNGGILQYYKSKNKYYTNDNPPTYGFIEQVGTNFFIPYEDTYFINNVITTIDKNNNKKYIPINIFGLEWNVSKHTPANGLPYLSYNEEIINFLLNMSRSNIIRHIVRATWNGLLDEEMLSANTRNIESVKISKDCKALPYNSTEISMMRANRALTKVSSVIET